MTARLSDIVSHIENVRQLDAVVTAMRGIAASHAQQSRGHLIAIESYSAIVARTIGEALRLAPRGWEQPGPAEAQGSGALILFCAEGGFCGGLSDRVFDEVGPELKANVVLQIGTRGAAIAEERGIRLEWTTSMTNHIKAVPTVAERIAQELYGGVAAGRFTTAEVVYPRPEGAEITIERLSLLPLDVRQFLPKEEAQPPLIELPFEVLVEQLAAEYVYALLCSAAMHAFQAESQARMAAMTAARSHIKDTLNDLLMREHLARQEEITDEIVELSASLTRIGAFTES